MSSEATKTKQPGAHAGPRNAARVLLVATILGTTYLDFFKYRAEGFIPVTAFDDRLAGQAPAPEQYRIGIYAVAHWMVAHLHIAPTMALAVLDGISGVIAVLLLWSFFAQTDVYQRADAMLRWFGAIVVVLLVQWFLAWLLWLQKVETMPAALFVAAILWLWQPRDVQRMCVVRPTALVVLNLLLASFRADLACLLNLGMLLYVLSGRRVLSLPRGVAMATAALNVLLAGGVQLWLMRVVYPQASYGAVKMWQLWPNVKHASRWPPFAVFLLPLLWMLWELLRRRLEYRPLRDDASRGLLCGAAIYAVLWVAIGKIDEVRIFLPVALALAPLTAEIAMVRVATLTANNEGAAAATPSLD